MRAISLGNVHINRFVVKQSESVMLKVKTMPSLIFTHLLGPFVFSCQATLLWTEQLDPSQLDRLKYTVSISCGCLWETSTVSILPSLSGGVGLRDHLPPINSGSQRRSHSLHLRGARERLYKKFPHCYLCVMESCSLGEFKPGCCCSGTLVEQDCHLLAWLRRGRIFLWSSCGSKNNHSIKGTTNNHN